MGNPHVVVPVDDLASIPFDAWGAALEVHPAFPAKTNVHFLQVHSRNRLEIRVWERGAGPTLACGTGACATLVAAVLLGLSDDTAEVMLPGGPLQIAWPNRSGSVLMTGPAVAVFDGVFAPELLPVGMVEQQLRRWPSRQRQQQEAAGFRLFPRLCRQLSATRQLSAGCRAAAGAGLSSTAPPSTRC